MDLQYEEQHFNINTILRKVFENLTTISQEKHIELIYEMDITVPKELRGNAESLVSCLTKLFTFIFEDTYQKEVILSLSAPEDFYYEESVTFEVKKSQVSYHKIATFIQENLNEICVQMHAQINQTDDADIKINIPFRVHELGFRRHYRLSDKSMLGKKILIICENKSVRQSIKKLFEYFSYEVDINDMDEGYNLLEYDILVTEDSCLTSSFRAKIIEAQKHSCLKCVWINEPHLLSKNMHHISAHINKPVTQEGIWNLIESLYGYEKLQENLKHSEDTPVDKGGSEKYHKLLSLIEDKNAETTVVLDRKKAALEISQLQKFLDIYGHSDVYLRQIINDEEHDKVEKFCHDMKIHLEHIGANKLYKVTEMIKLILEHGEYHLLSTYPVKYHVEFLKLKEEIYKILHP